MGEFTVPLGQPEILREGTDVTIVTYGAMCRIVLEAAQQLAEAGISCEVIDVQTLLPFDIDHALLLLRWPKPIAWCSPTRTYRAGLVLT